MFDRLHNSQDLALRVGTKTYLQRSCALHASTDQSCLNGTSGNLLLIRHVVLMLWLLSFVYKTQCKET